MQLGIYKYKGKMIWLIRIRTLNLMKMLYLKMRLQAGNDRACIFSNETSQDKTSQQNGR